jgi:hypothetical protein
MFRYCDSKSVVFYRNFSQRFWYGASPNEWAMYEKLIQPYLQLDSQKFGVQSESYVRKVTLKLQECVEENSALLTLKWKAELDQLLQEGLGVVVQEQESQLEQKTPNEEDKFECESEDDCQYFSGDEEEERVWTRNVSLELCGDEQVINDQEINLGYSISVIQMKNNVRDYSSNPIQMELPSNDYSEKKMLQVKRNLGQDDINSTQMESSLNDYSEKKKIQMERNQFQQSDKGTKLIGVRGITVDPIRNVRCYQLSEFNVQAQTESVLVNGRITEWIYFYDRQPTYEEELSTIAALEDCRVTQGCSEWMLITQEEMVLITKGRDLTPYYKNLQAIEINHLTQEVCEVAETEDQFIDEGIGLIACQFVRNQVAIMRKHGMLASGKNDEASRQFVRLEFQGWTREIGQEKQLVNYSQIVPRGQSPWDNGESEFDVEDTTLNWNASNYWRSYLKGIAVRGPYSFSRLKRVILLVVFFLLLSHCSGLQVDVSYMSLDQMNAYADIKCDDYIIRFDPRLMTQEEYDKMPLLYLPYIDAKLLCLTVQDHLRMLKQPGVCECVQFIAKY